MPYRSHSRRFIAARKGLLTIIPRAVCLKFGVVLLVVLVLSALGFRDRKETDVLQLMGRVARG
jgi:hypothetical protein